MDKWKKEKKRKMISKFSQDLYYQKLVKLCNVTFTVLDLVMAIANYKIILQLYNVCILYGIEQGLNLLRGTLINK